MVNKQTDLAMETLRLQPKTSDLEDFLKLPYHQAILNDRISLSIGRVYEPKIPIKIYSYLNYLGNYDK